MTRFAALALLLVFITACNDTATTPATTTAPADTFSGMASQQGGTVTGTVAASGTYCALVYDPGTLTAAVAYTITVAHP